MQFELALALLDFKCVVYIKIQISFREGESLSKEEQKHDLKSRIAVMEKEMFRLTGNERAKARVEYHKLLKSYSKECGLDEPIYLKRA